MIKTKLQTDIQNEVDIKDKDITDKSATISAKTSSSKYKGNVTLNYIVDKKIDLSSIITNEDLGTIITNGVKKPTADMIKTKLQTDIQNEVDIKDKDITDKSATISAKASSSKYKGNVTLNYIVDKKIDLSSIITNKNLGTIATNGVKKPTIDMIKNKLQTDIQNEVDIKDITDKSATISAKTSSSKYKGNVTISFTVDSKVELSSIITNKDLDTIATNGVKKPTIDMIKNKLQTDIQNEVDIKDITDKSATISAKTSSSKYKGNVTISFTVDSKVELSSIITNKNLGTIATNGVKKPTADMIKTKLQTDIQNEVDIKDKDITDKSATISAKASSSKYKGNVTISFTVDSKVELSSIITNKI